MKLVLSSRVGSTKVPIGISLIDQKEELSESESQIKRVGKTVLSKEKGIELESNTDNFRKE